MDWIQPWMASILSHPAVQAQKEQKHNPYTQSPDFSLSIQVYVTSKAFTTDDYLSDESLWAKAPASSVPVNIRYGKPLFPEVLDLQMAQQVGAMAVSICGPGSLGDDVRKAVRERQEGRTVDLYEDTFS